MEATIAPTHPSSVLATSPAPAVPAAATTAKPSKRALWIGRVLSGLAIAFLLFSAFSKFSSAPEVAASFAQLGLSRDLATVLAILELSCVALFAFPPTATFGALLLTGYLGGAVAIHLRVGDPLLTHTLFPCYVGAIVWIALSLRDPRLPALLRPRA